MWGHTSPSLRVLYHPATIITLDETFHLFPSPFSSTSPPPTHTIHAGEQINRTSRRNNSFTDLSCDPLLRDSRESVYFEIPFKIRTEPECDSHRIFLSTSELSIYRARVQYIMQRLTIDLIENNYCVKLIDHIIAYRDLAERERERKNQI